MFEVFMMVKIQVEVFWVVTPCNVAVGYQCFGGSCCFHLEGEVEAVGSPEMFLSYHVTTYHDNPEDLNFKLLKYFEGR
jgi:hypothetical protein